jgi:hypothetical protein
MKFKKTNEPISIKNGTWFYIDGKKLSVVHEIRDTRTPHNYYIRTDIIDIPFRKFLATAK